MSFSRSFPCFGPGWVGPGAAFVLALALLAADAGAARGQLRAPRPRERRDPAAGPFRLPTGAPGPGWWQQQVDYRVEATLQPGMHRLAGSAWITYYNNSPDTLTELYWHLYQNIFQPLRGMHGKARLVGPAPETTRGITIRRIDAGGIALVPEIDRTLMRTALPAPLPPGGRVVLHVEWIYEVPTTAVDLRTGRDGADYGMAQWYPALAVYDERGWDAKPYLGQGEFYLEYGDWDVRLRVPADYVVAATGTLRDPDAVLSPAEIERLGRASPDSVVHVIRAPEPRRFRRRAALVGATWHFGAERVRDFVWTASPTYVWDATRLRPTPGNPAGALVSAFYHPRERVYWSGAAALARRTMELYQTRLGDYLYPQVTAVSGPVRGMEYPMLVFGNPGNPVLNEPARVLMHELGHQWFPMMVGSDENQYALMDEGFVTFMTARALQAEFDGDDLFSHRLPAWVRRLGPSGDERLLDQTIYLRAARAGEEIPVLTPSDQIPVALYDVAAYMKPSTVLYMLRDVVGPDTLVQALQTYVRRWEFRHPRPDDFFNTVEDVAGRDLDWFWEEWFSQTWTLDMGIIGVRQTPGKGGWSAALDLANYGRAIMPATIRLTLANGAVRDVRVPETVWTGVEEYTFTVDSLPARVRSVVIDPQLVLPDIDRMDNRWPRPRVTADARPGAFMDLLPPLDAYRIGVSPSLGYARAAGAQLGLSAAGSYLGTDERLSAAFRIGSRNGRLDGELRYSDPIYAWGPGRSWWATAFRVDGRIGAGLGLDVAPGDWGGLITSNVAATRLRFGLEALALQDSSYIPEDVSWPRGNLVLATADVRHAFQGGRASGLLLARLEAGAPGSDWSYGLGQLEGRLDVPLGFGVHALARAVGGNASGNVPPQAAFDPAQATGLERFDSQLFRARGLLEAATLADNARLGGGGAIPGADPARLGTRLAAFNLALERGPFELFGDVGDAWSPPAHPAWTSDFGVGAGYELDVGQGPVHLLRWGLHLRLPLWVEGPEPGRSGWDSRWRIVFGGRWGD